ncbi:O-antigen ligase family protein [Bacillus rhizoplanae]|uniref:O-antigen ligase family protein n=1 Tax=Bacillus rhizoplanae TaxID=2880966 RepID=UPI003D2491B3
MLNIPNHSTRFIAVFIMFVMLSKYHIYVGFSLKIYMIFLIIYFCCVVAHFYFRPLYSYEVMLLLFYIIYCLSGAFSIYTNASIRIIFGVVLVLGCYFIMRYMMEHTTISSLEKGIGTAGLVFNVVSLLLYVIGLQQSGFHAEGEVISYGLMIDRNYPRLIGLLDDPNIFVFYNTLFFTFYLTHLRGFKHIIGFILCISTSLLTFSRGGIISLLLVILLYILMVNMVNKIKIITSLVIFSFIVICVANFITDGQIEHIISSRIQDFANDNGSGRLELWTQAFQYFRDSPYIGIGAFNFSDYYAYSYNKKLYVHNTLLEILSESGIFGFLSYVAFLTLLLVTIVTKRLHHKQIYLLLTLFAFILQMMSLSLIINEAFFLFLAITLKYILDSESEVEKHEIIYPKV